LFASLAMPTPLRRKQACASGKNYPAFGISPVLCFI